MVTDAYYMHSSERSVKNGGGSAYTAEPDSQWGTNGFSDPSSFTALLMENTCNIPLMARKRLPSAMDLPGQMLIKGMIRILPIRRIVTRTDVQIQKRIWRDLVL
jgi:hypothetical protein